MTDINDVIELGIFILSPLFMYLNILPCLIKLISNGYDYVLFNYTSNALFIPVLSIPLISLFADNQFMIISSILNILILIPYTICYVKLLIDYKAKRD